MLEIWLRRSTLSKLKLWLMDKHFNSRLSQPTCHSPQIFSLIYGLWPALRVQRSTIAWNMARPCEKQSACFSVYFSLKKKTQRGRAALVCNHKLECVWCHSHDAALQIFTSQHDDSQPPLGLHWQTDRYLICGLTGASQKKKKISWEFKLSGYFSKTNSIAGEVEGATPSRMWSYLKEKTRPRPWVWRSNQSCRQREGTSFKACFIESHKKWSGWIEPPGNQLEDTDINLSPPLEVNKHSPSMKEVQILSLYIRVCFLLLFSVAVSKLILIAALCLFSACVH